MEVLIKPEAAIAFLLSFLLQTSLGQLLKLLDRLSRWQNQL
jgi:hypothetical protein